MYLKFKQIAIIMANWFFLCRKIEPTSTPITLNAFNIGSRFRFILGVLMFVLLGANTVYGATYYSISSNTWTNRNTWSLTSGGNRVNNGVYPVAGDVVIIEGGFTVTLNANSTCANLNIASGSGISVGAYNFTVSGTTTVNGTITFTSITGTKNMGNVVISGGVWTSNVGEAYTIADLTLSGSTINGSNTGILNVSGNLLVSTGTTNTLNATTITVTGTTTVNGSIVFASATGTKVFVGQTTISSTGIWDNDNVNEAISFRNGLINNGTFYAGTSVYTFETNNQSITGTLAIPSLTVTGVTLTNNGNLTVATALSGTGGLTQGTNAVLNLGGTTGITTLTATASGNNVNYTAAAQTVKATPFYNLTLSGSGIKTTTGITVNGVLSMEGTATASATPTFGTAATLQYKGSSTQTTGSEFPTTFNGTGGVIIDNTNGVTLGAARIIGTASKLILTNGVLTTTTTNLLSITNTATTSITGGSAISFINGPVRWTLPASLSSGSTYNFPVGKSTTYLPFSLVNPTTGTGTVTAQVEAFNTDAGGTIDASLDSKSNTEYWSFISAGNFTNAAVSVSRPTTISPLDVVSGSATLTGQYTNLGGIAGAYGVSSSNVVGTNDFFALAVLKKTITTGTIAGSPFCAGASVSVPYTITGTFVGGNIFTAQLSNSAGSFASPINIGTLTSTTSGTISATIPSGTTTGSGYRIRVVSSNPAITGADNGVNLTINALPAIPATTGGLICIGSTATLSASGAVSGDRYVWYDAASGGNIVKTSTDNTDNTFTTPLLATTTNYWVSILSAGGCENSRTQVTATFPSASTDNQNDAGTNSWIGHVYDGTAFNTYYGRYTETETFDQSFGGASNCFSITSNSIVRSILTETFSVRYRMNSTKKGLYVVDLGSDDGSRLTVDGTLLYDNWVDQAYSSRPRILMNLTGSSSLVYDFNENGGENRVVFQNLTQILANNLTTNTTQSISVGSSGTAISGDIYGTLPTGISLSGTGYQWTYSTSPGGVRTNISGATGATYTPNASVAPFNVAGTYYIYRNAVLNSANNVAPNPYIATSESNVSTLTVVTPTIVVAPSSLTGFNYILGFGPSSQQSFTVSGSNLVANIIVTPTTNYEISTTSGSGFQSTPITLTQSGGVVGTTNIYVRLKAGLAVASYNSENIAITSTNAETKNVTCSGTVSNVPLISTTPSSLTGFSYIFGNGPSAQQSFSISGAYLIANITVTPSSNYEISTTSGSGFQSTPITLTQSGGIVAATNIYVRLKAGLAVGSYNSENIVSTSTTAVTKNVACSGTVNNVPLITTTPSSLTGFNYIFGNGPSAQQSFTVSGSYLVANISVTPSANYEISLTSGSGYQSTPITLTQSGGNVASTTIYVRLKTSLAVGTYNSQNIASSSTSAVTKNVTCSGTVSNVPLITTTPTSLTGFSYTVGYGPSNQQSFTVSGTYLVANITVTPSTNYEISTTSGTGFQSAPITLTQSGGTVSSTPIYVRLKAGLTAGNYNSENIATTSTSAVTKNILCSGTVNAPTINTSVATLTGFTYPEGYGPSAEQSFTVSGTNLVDNIRVYPSAKFEISTGTGAAFVPTSIITLPVSGGTVNSTTIYVRMKTGLLLGTVAAENIVSESTAATTKNVACSGTIVVVPLITTSAISGTFNYVFGSGPSTSRTFTVSGTNLGGSVVITPPADYEISSNGGTNYYSTAITLPLNSGNAALYTGVLNSTTITVRLKIALGTGSYSENVVATSTSAVSKNVALSGTVTASATIYNAISFLSGFIYSGAGPSGIQSFVVKASALTANVIATPPTNFEISKDGVNFQLTPITLNRVGTVLTTDTIVYVRLKSGLAVNDYGPLNSSVVLTSAGAITKSVACKGKVVNVRTLLVSKNTLTGFGYEYSASPVGGPSTPQSFTVSGAMLGGNIVITAPTNYEISQSYASGYASSISLTGTTVNPTLIYVRLKSGLTAASYGTLVSPVNLSVATTGFTTINVACIGKVFASPLISASGGGSYCAGSTINLTSSGSDIISQYWTGPNSYYSSLQNPVLTTNATTNLTGTYIVNGNVVVGGNLITNGDFEAGNSSFSSGYGYVAPSAAALNPEGLYTIVNLPSAVHGDFTNYPDHTTGTGLQMIVNGSPTAGVVVWSQSVPVIPGAIYQFTYSEQTVNISQYPKNASQLQLYVNGVAAGPVYTAPQDTLRWATFLYNASAGTNTVLNLELINQNTIAAGNDFALDDIIFQQILPATASTVVTVNPVVPVSVSIAASPGTSVYSNTPVTFTATPTNGGTTPTYQWKVNGVNVGTNSPTYNYIPLQGDVVTCTLTSSLTCVTNNPATATLNMTVTYRVNYWMGYIDTDWGKSGNWTNNFVPLTGDDVEYATVANFGASAMRDLHLDIDRTIGSLINATTKRLVIPAGKGLTVNNTVNTDGNADRIYIYSSSTLANGSLSFKNIESMPVSATVEMYSKASWDLTKPINNKYKWQYFGIPLRSVKAEPTFYGSYVRKWYETGTTIQNHWIQLGNDSIIQPFYGYEICQEAPKTVIFKGQLVNKSFNSGQLAITPTALYPGQHVFANPYTAAIDIRQLTFGTSTQATVYLYNTGTFTIWQNDGGYTSGTNEGQYVAIPNNLAGFTGLPRQVPSMQAMLVKAQNVSSEAYFGINYNAVIMNNTDLQRAKDVENESDKVCTRIDVKGKHFSDKMWIFTEPGCSNNFDNGWDGFKFLGSSVSPQIFAKESDGDYQVTTVGDMNNSSIYFQAGEDTEYTLTFTHTNLKKKYQGVYLVDLVENRTVEITETGTEYKFSTESTPKALNRFTIVTRPYEESSADLNSLVKVFNAGKTVFIHNFSNVDGELTIYDISGRILKKGTFIANGVTAINTNYISGGYIVRVKTSLEEISKRIILR